jgi:hypothetical protein
VVNASWFTAVAFHGNSAALTNAIQQYFLKLLMPILYIR